MSRNLRLRVFLCHASDDKPTVRELYNRLATEGWIDPWLDEMKLRGGQDWDIEIYKAMREADVIVVCLSRKSVIKEGYVQKEIKRALDFSDEKPDGTIYVIPLKFDECEIPLHLKKWHWIDFFAPNAYGRLLDSLRIRARKMKPSVPSLDRNDGDATPSRIIPDLFSFIPIRYHNPAGQSYPFWIGRYPITNSQYARFVNSRDHANQPDFSNPRYWLDFPKFDEYCHPIGDLGRKGVSRLKKQLKGWQSKVLKPRFWEDPNVGKSKLYHPVVGITWYEANAYCEWLLQKWEDLPESEANPSIRPSEVRLPLETEWVAAAGGTTPLNRYPWDRPGLATTKEGDILRRANVKYKKIGATTPVNYHPLGKSIFEVMDMAGNVWEWQANYRNQDMNWMAMRGGSHRKEMEDATVSSRSQDDPNSFWVDCGFRVVLLP